MVKTRCLETAKARVERAKASTLVRRKRVEESEEHPVNAKADTVASGRMKRAYNSSEEEESPSPVISVQKKPRISEAKEPKGKRSRKEPSKSVGGNLPRFQPENMEHNKRIFELVSEMAASKGCTPAQLALAWVLHQGDDVVPIPGTTKNENLKQNIGALSVELTSEEMSELEALAAAADDVKGDRYGGAFRTYKDSDTPPLSSWKPE